MLPMRFQGSWLSRLGVLHPRHGAPPAEQQSASKAQQHTSLGQVPLQRIAIASVTLIPTLNLTLTLTLALTLILVLA